LGSPEEFGESLFYFYINRYKKSDCSQADFSGSYFIESGKGGSEGTLVAVSREP
jgi:hypothetical protein